MPDLFDEIETESFPTSARMKAPPRPVDIFDEIEPESDIFGEIETPRFEPTTVAPGVDRRTLAYSPTGEAFTPEQRRAKAEEQFLTEGSYPVEIGKAVAQGTQVVPKIIAEGGQIIRQSLGMPESEFRKSVKETERILQTQAGDDKTKQYVTGAIRTLAEMGGSGFNLPLLVSRAGVEKTTEALEAGKSMGISLLAGTGQAATEYVTEKIPFSILTGKGTRIGSIIFKPAKSFLGRLAQGIVTDVPGELLATFTEMKGINEQLLDREYTDEELKQALIDTAAVAGLTSLFATGATQPFIPSAQAEGVAPETTPTEVAPEMADIFDEISPEEAPTLEQLSEEFEAPEEKKLQPFSDDAIFDIGEQERRLENGLYVPDTVTTEARTRNEGSPLAAAEEVGRRSLRAISEADARDFSGIKDHAHRRAVARPIRDAEARAIMAWAESEGKILSDFERQHDVKSREYGEKGLPLGGTDNFTYLDPDSGRWLKANKFKFASTYTDLMGRVMMHNDIFPEIPYEFEGMANLYGEVRPVFSQADIIEDKGVTKAQKLKLAEEELIAKGFERHNDPKTPDLIETAEFRKGDIIVTDINERNVIIKDGKAYIFDPVIYLDPTTKSQRLVGRKIEGPAVEAPVEEEVGIDFGDIFDEIEQEELAAQAEAAEKAVAVEETQPMSKAKILEQITKPLQNEAGQITLPERHAPRPEGLAGEVYDDIAKSRDTSLEKKKKTIKQTMRNLKTSIVDVSGNIKAALSKLGPEGKAAVMRHIAYGGAHTKGLRLFDMAHKQIYGGLTGPEHDYLDQYIYAKRHIEIKDRKPDFVLPGGRSKAHMQALIDSIPGETRAKIEERARLYWKTMDQQIQELHKEGLLTDAQLKALRSTGKYYSPRVVLDYIDPEMTSYEGGKKITVPDSGIKKLSEEGTEGLIESDTSLLLSQVITRTQSRIFKNRANQALWELAEAQPDNPLIRKAKIIRTTETGRLVFQDAPRGWEKISVMIEGQKKEMMMPSEFAGEWIFKDPILLASQRNLIQWLSGTKILKSMATGLNPEFAFTNLPRDIALIWMSTEEYSPALPKALGQVGLDMGSVAMDAIFRRGAYDEYIDQGGGMEFLTHQGRFASKLPGMIGNIQKVMGYLGETSEIMTRLALRNRAIKNGATPEQATIIARSYLDFSQGGNLAKAADSALPYLNAGIQATRAITRAAATNPKLFSAKVGQVAGLATMLYLANRLINEDAWDEIPDRDKVNNWIITTPYSYIDDTGTKRHIYFKIAKDQGQRIFASIFENIAAKSIGDEANVDQALMAVRDFIPFSPTNLPPTVEAILGYTANKDFWFNEDIWKGPEVRPEEEYTRYTPKALVEIGQKTGLSPERLKSSLQQLFTYGNIWTSLVGGGVKAAMGELSEADKNLVIEEVILKQPFVRKIVRSTDPVYKYAKDIEEAGIEERTEKHKINRNLDLLIQDYFNDQAQRSDVVAFIKEQAPVDRKRLVSRFKSHEQMRDMPERRFWVELMQEPPKTRAYIYWGRWKQASDEKKKELEKVSFTIPKFRGQAFNYYLRELEKNK